MALCFPGPQPDAHLLNMIGCRRRDITITGVTVHTGADEEGAERGAKNTTTVRIKIGEKGPHHILHSYLESFFFFFSRPHPTQCGNKLKTLLAIHLGSMQEERR